MSQVSSPNPSVWTAYTPTVTNGPTTSSIQGWYRKEGDSLRVRGALVASGTGAGSVMTIAIPGTFTIDTSKLAGTNKDALGSCKGFIGGLGSICGTSVNAGAGAVNFITNKSNANSLLGSDLANGDSFTWDALIPVL